MQRKTLPQPAKNNQQVKEYTSAVQRGLNDYYVSYSGETWTVRRAGGAHDNDKFQTKIEAIGYAKKLADSQADVVVHGKDGTVTVLQLKN